MVAGDSAIALDPLSSQGVFNALVTGIEAGQTARALLGGGRTAPGKQAGSIGRIWRAYLGHHAVYYGMEQRWVSVPFWQRRSAIAFTASASPGSSRDAQGAGRARQPNREATVSHMADTGSVGLPTEPDIVALVTCPTKRVIQEHAGALLTATKGKVYACICAAGAS